MEELRKSGMMVSADDEVLEYDRTWNTQEIDRWMRTLFPKAFEWLDARWGRPEDGTLHWILLQKVQRKVIIIDRASLTGEHLHSSIGGVTSRGWRDHVIHISKYFIYFKET